MSRGGLLIVGYAGESHVGHHLADAAVSLGLPVRLIDATEAYQGPFWKRQAAWRLAGHRPARLRAFSAKVEAEAIAQRPDALITTGLAPVDLRALEAIGRAGVPRINFLTDDPWNRVHRAPWFTLALPHYDHVWSPRKAPIEDLRRAGARRASYLPFAFNPSVHWREELHGPERARWAADVVLAGGADADRVRWIEPLLRAGLDVALYGGYWNRFGPTRGRGRGMLEASGLRRATVAARVSLGLVRRANRDGHSMRTFEVPAMGGCLLAERTADHEELFGPDGETVLYADRPADVVDRVRWLLDHPGERDRLALAAHTRISTGGHTYADRLRTMIEAV